MALRKILLVAALAATGVAAPLISGGPAAGGETVAPGVEVLAARPTPLRDAPPKEGLFYAGKGEALGEIQSGEIFEVRAVARVRKPLGDEIWLHLGRMGGMGGWAYAGPAGDPWANFRKVEAR